VAGKHSKRTKSESFSRSYDASKTSHDAVGGGGGGEQGQLDSIVADLLKNAVEAENAMATTKPRFDFDKELDAVIDNAFKNASATGRTDAQATAKKKADRKTTDSSQADVKTTDSLVAKEQNKPVTVVSEQGKPEVFDDGQNKLEALDEQGASAVLDEQGTDGTVKAEDELQARTEVDDQKASGSLIAEPINRRAIWPLFICAVVVFIVLTGGLTYFNRWLMVGQADERAAIQQKGNSYLDESIALIQEADSVIVALDKASESRVTEEDIPRLEALLEQASSVQDSLDNAIEKAILARETFLEKERQDLAQRAQDAAGYRKQMLEMNSELTNFDIAAMRSALGLEYAWGLIVDADADMRSAVEVITVWGGTTTESRDYNQQAFDKLVLADAALVAAGEAFPTADLRILREYLNVKKASAELALASDDALLEGDYYLASTRNEEFIAKDAEAVGLAANIPSDPLSLVFAAYEEATVQLREEYKVVRSQAADTDVYLRAYLGVDVQ
jgi:hypothetical protein